MILDEIVEHTKRNLAQIEISRFRSLFGSEKCVLICELKIKSPSHPAPFTTDMDTVLSEYKSAGIDAISVVTNQEYFGGDLGMVLKARDSGLPVLRKDFILETHQIAEVSTDALLLIVRIVSKEKLKELVHLCLKLNIEPIVEIHDETDLENALYSGAITIAVNARDLQTQSIDQSAALRLLEKIPDNRIKLLFSGIKSPKDIENARISGANGVLVGTAVLDAPNRLKFIRLLKEACS